MSRPNSNGRIPALFVLVPLFVLLILFARPVAGLVRGDEGKLHPTNRPRTSAGNDSLGTVDLMALPVCLKDGQEINSRSSTSGWRRIPAVVKSDGTVIYPGGEVKTFNISDAHARVAATQMSYFAAPTLLPSWAGCHVANVEWDLSRLPDGTVTRSGSLIIDIYAGEDLAEAAYAMTFHISDYAPQMPPRIGDWQPIVNHTGWFQDIGATGNGPEGVAEGVRIVWTDEKGHYFELIGPFPLGDALAIGESVPTDIEALPINTDLVPATSPDP